MPKNRIKSSCYERVLLTDVLPYETPIRFSNWGSFNYLKNFDRFKSDSILAELFNSTRKYSIPFHYDICKDLNNKRTLQLIHPNNSKGIVDFYTTFDTFIAKLCTKSAYSIRAPHSIGKSFDSGNSIDHYANYLKNMEICDPYASTYFKYKDFSHLYKFFNSDELLEFEKRFCCMTHFDITNFFPSIYTHTISWAVRSKHESKKLLDHRRKDNSFSSQFDKLIQKMNFNETNGIPVGPEISRIFSEIILQSIDLKIETRMEENKYIHNVDYCCCRYMDDFFIFHNNEDICNKFQEIVIDELQIYKLYINNSKTKKTLRPFITDVSKKKLEVSECLNSLTNNLFSKKYNTLKSTLDKLRIIASDLSDNYYALSNVVLTIIQKHIMKLKANEDLEICERAIHAYLKVSFQWFSIDTRVNNSYKLAKIVLSVLMIIDNYTCEIAEKIKSEIYNYLYTSILETSNQGNPIVTINLLIAQKELGDKYKLNISIVKRLIKKSNETFNEDSYRVSRLSYYSIIGFIFYIEDNPKYKKIFDDLLLQVNKIIEDLNPVFYSESAYLLIDVIKCPYISKPKKFEIIKPFISHLNNNFSDPKIYSFIKKINEHDWYFDWNSRNSTIMHLEKKNFMVTY